MTTKRTRPYVSILLCMALWENFILGPVFTKWLVMTSKFRERCNSSHEPCSKAKETASRYDPFECSLHIWTSVVMHGLTTLFSGLLHFPEIRDSTAEGLFRIEDHNLDFAERRPIFFQPQEFRRISIKIHDMRNKK